VRRSATAVAHPHRRLARKSLSRENAPVRAADFTTRARLIAARRLRVAASNQGGITRSATEVVLAHWQPRLRSWLPAFHAFTYMRATRGTSRHGVWLASARAGTAECTGIDRFGDAVVRSEAPDHPAGAAILSMGGSRRLLALAALLGAGGVVQAHNTGTSYLIVDAHEASGAVKITWDLAISDLDWTLDLDANRDGGITWAEVQSAQAAIGRLATRHLSVQRGGAACAVELTDVRLTRHTSDAYGSLQLNAQCVRSGALELGSSLYFRPDIAQRTLVDVTTPAGRFNTVLSPAMPSWREPAKPSPWSTFGRFLVQGIWHVWTGYDHLAFLLLLLLPSVLHSTGGDWRAATSKRAVGRDIITIVTAFTLAHSITLGLAATHTVELPSQPIEIAIAGTIVVAGLLNLVPRLAPLRLALAFGFGLIHGFGFANALAELSPTGFALLPMLAGFNIGVEVAQLCVVALLLPILLRWRASPLYAARLMPVLSMVTAMAGALWLAGRVP
jgi:hypothetical protein